ncbi:MAG: Stk1 family PASTA domain-containing Ser/Thr kinase [Bacilli bacterium]|nr:Stk1 family PASTA domain-containing Ser/Thr kinase [Bacilli bacterium]
MITKGQKINDRYEIIKSIGEGGMANVYLARDVILDRRVAIKILRGDLANDDKFIRRFQREALSASSLSHPNIVEMYDVGEDNGNYYIVMEFVEGKTLKQYMKKRTNGHLTISEAVDIMLQLTDGISHAHDSYIIHRDLKPQNIMIQDDGKIKITDFGIAMALNSTQLTQTNSVMGSVHYLPPEQATGKGSTIKCDIYSMGILFYELLTGMLPFKGENAVEIALKHMKEPLPSVRKHNPSIPQSVENIILKSTAKNPKNRYNDVKEMHNDLKRALDPDVLEQKKYVYPHPELELDDTKPMKAIKKEKKEETVKDEDNIEDTGDFVKEITNEKDKKFNIVIWVLSIILFLIIGGMCFVFFVLPSMTAVPNITVPDVSGLSVVDAEDLLIQKGFTVADETEKVASEEFDAGEVIKTSPRKGSTRKKGTKITLYESIGSEVFELEDYVGKNYIEVQTLLTNVYGLSVKIEPKEIEITDDTDEQAIIEQSIPAGTEVKKGDEIILYIPEIVDEYPDFIGEEWTVADVQAFCEKNNIKLDVKEVETNEYAPGKIFYQSRTGRIVSGVTLTIKVAKEISLPPEINPGPTEGDNNNSTTDTDNNEDN